MALIGYRSGLDTILEIVEELGIELLGIYDKYFYGNTADTHGIPFIGSEDDISESDKANINFFLSSGWAGHINFNNPTHHIGDVRKQRINLIKEQQLTTVNLINPHSYVHRTSLDLLGTNILIGHGCQIRARVSINDFGYIDNLSSIGHDVTIGENLIMAPYSFVGGHIDIGSDVLIGAGSTIVSRRSDRNLKIGNDVKIIAGSTVIKDIPDGKTFVATSKSRMMANVN